MGAREYDIVDRQLGHAILGWAERARKTGIDLDVQGPLPAPGMDPTWIIRITVPWRDAEVLLFRGPHAEVAWFDPRKPEHGPHIEGHDDLTPASIVELLERLAADERAT